MTDDELAAAIRAELTRLGLDWAQAPFDVVRASDDAHDTERSGDPFLRHLQGLRPGATWREVFVDLPAHWDLADPQTWSVPYRPLGPLDYPVLPTGPALMLAWPEAIDEGCLERLLGRATAADFRVHAMWFIPLTSPFPERLAYVVLSYDTTYSTFVDFQAFVAADAEARLWAIARTGTEHYHPSGMGPGA